MTTLHLQNLMNVSDRIIYKQKNCLKYVCIIGRVGTNNFDSNIKTKKVAKLHELIFLCFYDIKNYFNKICFVSNCVGSGAPPQSHSGEGSILIETFILTFIANSPLIDLVKCNIYML